MEAIISMSKMASALIIGWARMNLLEFFPLLLSFLMSILILSLTK